MKLKQDARVLRGKALASLTIAVEAFNSPHDLGRISRVLLHLQHAFEMLLKAALVQSGTRVFDPSTGRSEGFDKCVRLAAGDPRIKLSEADAGTLRAIDAMRDDEQHWFNHVAEQLLYLHARAAVTLFDEILQRAFDERLVNHLPTRVLPVSVDPPRDLALIVDEEYSQIASLLKPGRRAGHEARARIRTLLAMEAHVADDVRVSDRDVSRVERGIRSAQPRDEVFPRLGEVATSIDGSGITVTVHFTKKQGAPVRFVADDTVPAAAIREIDLQNKFHWAPKDLADKLEITHPKSSALREHLGIDHDDSCAHRFSFGSQHHLRFSDNAYRKMREALKTVDMDKIWGSPLAYAYPRATSPLCHPRLLRMIATVRATTSLFANYRIHVPSFQSHPPGVRVRPLNSLEELRICRDQVVFGVGAQGVEGHPIGAGDQERFAGSCGE